MDRNLLITAAATALPILAIIFVIILCIHKLYINIRSRYPANVNCWFCNCNSRVPYEQRNSWMCTQCDQYNGFTKDGDYNRDILLHHNKSIDKNSSNGSNQTTAAAAATNGGAACINSLLTAGVSPPVPTNGLCDQCNEAQRLKIEKLAQFEPKYESRFDSELKTYTKQLEQQFRLCRTCERHVNNVLREKKKMVLGSKFLNLIVKGAALLKHPQFNQLATVKQQRKLQKCQQLMLLLTVVNISCQLYNLPLATLEQFVATFGEFMGKPLFISYSHFLTLFRVAIAYMSRIGDYELIAKFILYIRTFVKMFLFSVSINNHNNHNNNSNQQQMTIQSCFCNLYPYFMLTLSIIHNLIDGLKFTRFTLLLALWSLPLLSATLSETVFMVIGCMLTIIVIGNWNWSSTTNKLNETTESSFHRLYADDCFSDDESISMLSHQLNSSNSNYSYSNSYSNCNSINRLRRPPSVLSLDSLHLSSSQRTIVPPPTTTTAATQLPMHLYRSSPFYSSTTQSNLDAPIGWRNSGFMGYAASAAPPPPPAPPSLIFSLPSPSPSLLLQQQQQPTTQPSQYQRSNNLLMPSRFNNNNKNNSSGSSSLHQQQQHQQPMGNNWNRDVSAWVASTSITNNCPKSLYNGGCGGGKEMTTTDGKLSRTSSQSSGFESQLGQQTATNNNNNIGFGFTTETPLFGSASSQFGWPKATTATATVAAATTTTIKPGDLLRKWIDRNATEGQQQQLQQQQPHC